jgi:hypothetical protein
MKFYAPCIGKCRAGGVVCSEKSMFECRIEQYAQKESAKPCET